MQFISLLRKKYHNTRKQESILKFEKLTFLSKSNIIGRTANIEFDQNLIEENHLGSMTEICEEFNAKHFAKNY